jgi:isobutyryl-CoA dehydrogenase
MLGVRAIRSLVPKVASRMGARAMSGKTGLDCVHPTIGLNEDQASFYELARGFSDTEMYPNAQEWDETAKFPVSTFEKLAELGFAGIFVREEHGGSALSRVDTTVIIEALATGCVGTTAMLTIHNMCAGMVDKFGSDEHRAEWLPKLCSMEVKASYCLTEPGSGSDAASLLTKAEKVGEEYVLNGGKAFISGAGLSDVYLVMARTGKPGPKGISCMIVPKDAPGLSFGADEKKMGWKVQPTRQLIFEDCKIPIGNILGQEGNGWWASVHWCMLTWSSTTLLRVSIGIHQRTQAIWQSYC